MTMTRFLIQSLTDEHAELSAGEINIRLPITLLPAGSSVDDEVVLDILSDDDTMLGAYGRGNMPGPDEE